MCAVAIGALGHLGVRKEASFASGGAVDSWQPFISESLELTYNNVYSDKVRNTAEQVNGQSGNMSVAGNVTFYVTPKNPIQWWNCGLGGTAFPFSVARPLSSMLLQVDRETAAVQVSGCMIGGLTFSSSQGGELTCSTDLEAAGMGSVTAGSPTYTENDAPYLHQEATFALNGTNDNSVTAFSLSIANNLGTDLFGTGTQRIDIPAGKLIVSGSFTKLFDDTVERNAFLNAQSRSFKATFARGANNLVLFCPTIRYNSHPENISSQADFILETFQFTGYTDSPSTVNSVRISGDSTS